MCVMYSWRSCHALSSVNNFCHGIHAASQGHCKCIESLILFSAFCQMHATPTFTTEMLYLVINLQLLKYLLLQNVLQCNNLVVLYWISVYP